MDKILVRGLEVSACHGVHGFEKVTPQKFVFDADLYCDFYCAAKCDDLEKTINYSAVCDKISSFCRGNSFDLIEKLAYSCAFLLLDSFPISRITLTVFKPEAPVKHKFLSVGASVDISRETAYLSLGSSLGDRRAYINSALEKLSSTQGIKLKKVSDIIETEPYGGVARNRFLNCAAEIETYLSPRQLLFETSRIENECGRERKARWGDRTLDIDIIFFGAEKIAEKGLVIPHPEYSKRDFVLKPLKQIAPDFVCPDSGRKLSDI